ncbi:MAG: TonB-dependent receptor plug domain-containing protein [Bacteroidetes bacterium]|nr:TonB-dependent receptor plug domain-containing protein [Fibrella sp.]
MRLLFTQFTMLCLTTGTVIAQTAFEDSTRQLNEVKVTGYATNRRLLETGASVGLLTSRDLQQRFGTPTLVPSLNTLPGVRIDERSPGSYRLAIRGSAIRSPFGVRNVKVYWNELPLTDAGGNTYLNALDVRAIGRVEVIKGPSGSLYGAGTGGTILFSGLNIPAGQSAVEVSTLAGAYGLRGNGITLQTGKNDAAITLSYNHIQADGYREHSQSARDNLSLTGSFQVSEKRTISVLGLYSDLYYQTPGGLTEAQYRANPRASRLATRTLPSSAEQGAAIYQKTGYLGLSHEYRWNDRIQNTTVLYGSTVDFTNPFITNYEKRADQGLGGRTVTQIRVGEPVLPTIFTVGAEYQQNFTVGRNYGNRRGQPDTLQSDDELRARQSVVFAQAEVTLPLGIIGTLGVSRNEVRYGFTRFSTLPITPQSRNFAPVWLPRLSVLKKLGDHVAAFASISTGYSAPTTQEVRPSDQVFNASLNPERGQNIEVGLRGAVLKSKVRFDLVYYSFQLRETIVRRSTAAGAEFFVNAGRTNQPGFEGQLSYDFLRQSYVDGQNTQAFFQLLRLWTNATLTNYQFRDYVQGTADLSGNRVTGVAPTLLTVGLDAETRPGLYGHLTYQFIDQFPLLDAGTVISDPARLLSATLGFRRSFAKRWTVDAYLSGDNLLDQTYSLGYDLNAVGSRYYNASARRNLTGGVRVGVKW